MMARDQLEMPKSKTVAHGQPKTPQKQQTKMMFQPKTLRLKMMGQLQNRMLD
jgi:hypothetical protein